MRPGGKTVVIPGPGGVVILSPGFDSPLGPLPALGETTAEDATHDDPQPPAPPADEIEIFPAPFLSRTSPAAGRQGANPFRPLDAFSSALRPPAPQAPAAMAVARPPEGTAAATAAAPQAAARPAPWYARAWSAITSAIGSLFGGSGSPPPSDPYWERIREPVKQEIAHLRTLGDMRARQAYLRSVGDEVVANIQRRHGTAEIGFHYNLHGGQSPDYIEAGGIRAMMGDLMAGMSFTPNAATFNDKVYFFSSAHYNLYDILDESNPNMLWFGMFDGRAESSLPSFSFFSRMGHILIPFRLDSDYLRTALAEGGAFNRTATSIDFNPNWIRAHNGGRKIGIPASTFLTPPLTVFVGVRQRLGIGRLSRDEETLAVMRYIEARAIASAPQQQSAAAKPPLAPPAAAPEAPGVPPPPSEIPQLTSFRGPLDLYHTTPVAEGRNILAHGFVAAQIDEEGTAAGVFYPAGYTGTPVIRERRDVIPEGGSGIYFGLSGDDTWRGGGFGFWGLQWEGRFEIRVHVPADSGLRIVDLREPGNLAYVKQWVRTHHTGSPLHGKHVDQFATEHDIDILIRRGRTGRDSYEDVVFKSSRAYAYLNGLPREGHEPSSSDED